MVTGVYECPYADLSLACVLPRASSEWCTACRKTTRLAYYLVQLLLSSGCAGTPAISAGRHPPQPHVLLAS